MIKLYNIPDNIEVDVYWKMVNKFLDNVRTEHMRSGIYWDKKWSDDWFIQVEYYVIENIKKKFYCWSIVPPFEYFENMEITPIHSNQRLFVFEINIS